MKLIKLKTIEGRTVAIALSEIMSIEEGDYMARWENNYGFSGEPTRVILKQFNYTVKEDFDTVCKLIEGAGNE